MKEDRALRDSARALFRKELAHVSREVRPGAIGERIANRVGAKADDVADAAVDFAEGHGKTVAAAIIGALAAAGLWFARERMEGAFCIANGDVVFAADVVRGALDRMRPGMNLLVERAPGHLDDMRVAIDEERIAAVAKTLDPRVALFRSLGILLSPSGGESYRAMVEEIVNEDGGPGQAGLHRTVCVKHIDEAGGAEK